MLIIITPILQLFERLLKFLKLFDLIAFTEQYTVGNNTLTRWAFSIHNINSIITNFL